MYTGNRGTFKMRNPQKYRGETSKCVFRSSLERRFMKYCDKWEHIVQWNCEVVKIPYICRTDGQKHTYIMDFWIRTNTGKQYLVEVKPHEFTSAPKIPERKTKNYYNKVTMWGKNQSKWEAAEKYAQKRGMEFKILTEKHLQPGSK